MASPAGQVAENAYEGDHDHPSNVKTSFKNTTKRFVGQPGEHVAARDRWIDPIPKGPSIARSCIGTPSSGLPVCGSMFLRRLVLIISFHFLFVLWRCQYTINCRLIGRPLICNYTTEAIQYCKAAKSSEWFNFISIKQYGG